MKKLTLFLLIILTCTLLPPPADAGQGMMPGMGIKKYAAACTPGTTNACQNGTTGECGTTYLLCEDFEGATSCGSGRTSNCRNTYTAYNILPNFQGTALTGEGTYSALLDTSASYDFYKVMSDADGMYVFFKMKTGTLTHDASPDVFRFIDAGYANYILRLRAEVNASHTVTDWYMDCTGGTGQTAGTPTVADNTLYYIWAEVTKGATNTCRVYISTTATKPGSPTLESTDGTPRQVGIAQFWSPIASSGGHPVTFDHIRIKSTQITGFPD